MGWWGRGRSRPCRSQPALTSRPPGTWPAPPAGRARASSRGCRRPGRLLLKTPRAGRPFCSAGVACRAVGHCSDEQHQHADQRDGPYSYTSADSCDWLLHDRLLGRGWPGRGGWRRGGAGGVTGRLAAAARVRMRCRRCCRLACWLDTGGVSGRCGTICGRRLRRAAAAGAELSSRPGPRCAVGRRGPMVRRAERPAGRESRGGRPRRARTRLLIQRPPMPRQYSSAKSRTCGSYTLRAVSRRSFSWVAAVVTWPGTACTAAAVRRAARGP